MPMTSVRHLLFITGHFLLYIIPDTVTMKLIKKNQSAGNLFILIKQQGSSETTRDISYSPTKKDSFWGLNNKLIDKRYMHSQVSSSAPGHAQEKKQIKRKHVLNMLKNKKEIIQLQKECPKGLENKIKDFYYWLGGLIDGDGSLLLNKSGYVNIEITLDVKDVRTLMYLKKNIGFGNITKRSGVKAVRWRTAKKEHIIVVLENLEGKLLTETKQKQWKICTDAYNIKAQQEFKDLISFNNNISKINEIIKHTSWFSGFFDAEGHFNIMNKTTLAFHIGQKNPKILNKMHTALKLGHIRYDKSWQGWIYSITDKEGIRQILNQFTNYPIHTTKNTNIFTFKRLLTFISKKYHLLDNQSIKYKRVFNLINLFKKKI